MHPGFLVLERLILRQWERAFTLDQNILVKDDQFLIFLMLLIHADWSQHSVVCNPHDLSLEQMLLLALENWVRFNLGV